MLKTARDHLKQLAREKEELLGMISHYVQNNLAAMSMTSRLLLDRTQDQGDPKLRLMAENIHASSNQMRVFIKALLANAAEQAEFLQNHAPGYDGKEQQQAQYAASDPTGLFQNIPEVSGKCGKQKK